MYRLCLRENVGERKGQTKWIAQSMDTENTIKAVKKVVIPFAEHLSGAHPMIDFELEGDNAPGHCSKTAQRFLRNLEFNHVPFGGHPINDFAGRPPNSPDLCVIEYCFAWWEERVMKRQPRTTTELINVCEEEWANLPQEWIQSTYRHMLKVYPWVKGHGGNEYGKK